MIVLTMSLSALVSTVLHSLFPFLYCLSPLTSTPIRGALSPPSCLFPFCLIRDLPCWTHAYYSFRQHVLVSILTPAFLFRGIVFLIGRPPLIFFHFFVCLPCYVAPDSYPSASVSNLSPHHGRDYNHLIGIPPPPNPIGNRHHFALVSRSHLSFSLSFGATVAIIRVNPLVRFGYTRACTPLSGATHPPHPYLPPRFNFAFCLAFMPPTFAPLVGHPGSPRGTVELRLT